MSKSSFKKGSKIILFLIFAAAAAAAIMLFSKAKTETKTDEMFTMSTNAERVEFLNKQGWIVKPDPLSKEEITVPSEFDGAYAEYAALQQSQGFDIEKYKGMPAFIIKYRVLNYPDHPDNVTAAMMISNGRLIGGDISMTGEGGFTEPLLTASAQTHLSLE